MVNELKSKSIEPKGGEEKPREGSPEVKEGEPEEPISEVADLESPAEGGEPSKFAQELEDARNNYAKKHYEASKSIHWIKKILPLSRTEVDSAIDVMDAYDRYKKARNNLLNSEIENIKKQELNDIEMKEAMGNLIKRYNFNERKDLIDARTNARAKAREGKIGEDFVKVSLKVINAYRKLDWKWKAGIAVGLFATGGVVGASIIAGISFSKRAVSSAAFGVGTTVGLEARQRRKEEKEAGELKEEILGELEIEEGEDKLARLREFLIADMENSDQVLSREIKSAKVRNLIGTGVGLASFALPLGLKYFSYLHENVADAGGATKEAVKAGKTVAKAAAENVAQHTTDAEGTAKEMAKAGKTIVKQVAKNKAETAAQKVSELVVGEKSSVEGTIIKQLMSDGMSKEDAGRLANLMAKDYAKDHGLGERGMYSSVQSGTQIRMEYDPIKNSYRIADVNGGGHKMGWLEKNSHDSVAGEDGKSAVSEHISTKGLPEYGFYGKSLEWNWTKGDINELHDKWLEHVENHKQIEELQKLVDKAKFEHMGQAPSENWTIDSDWDFNERQAWDQLQKLKAEDGKLLESIKKGQRIFVNMWGDMAKGSLSGNEIYNQSARDYFRHAPKASDKNAVRLFKFMKYAVDKFKIDTSGKKTVGMLTQNISDAILKNGFPY